MLSAIITIALNFLLSPVLRAVFCRSAVFNEDPNQLILTAPSAASISIFDCVFL